MSLRKNVLALSVDQSKYSLPPIPARTTNKHKNAKDFTPIDWSKYFTNCHVLNIKGDSFNVYEIGSSGPLLVLLHGGGFSALTWALFSKEIVSLVKCHIIAIDLRGHGNTVTTDDDDLSALTMAKDVSGVISTLCPDKPPVILMGHSMGGAIAVHAVYNDLIANVVGLIVIDVVEGTAMDALASMQSFLKSRPSSFKTVQEAIRWSMYSGQVKNIESARVSVPGQIKNTENNVLAASEIFNTNNEQELDEPDICRAPSIPETIKEEEEDVIQFQVPSQPKVKGKYVWRIDLCKTEKYWTGWFQGLSQKFLLCPAQKLLLLANIDRLDKNLMVGQMQGRFSMQVLSKVGHAVHEDDPTHVAEIVANYLVRNHFAEPLVDLRVSMPAC